ncbi:homoserine dehydrogenase [Natribacillus halophilus]|uniref:Homoserine dehydrogenase n=1 Tax=Natribacillus halophilus TaxID=549003 RepID=A0A1G8J829_9BACI|nr:homoserine dehydrogenase [Natribacillus halophilus]SDI27418.1 homoserine dehydrogenase [Natribacillus halophilus]
MKHKVAIIGFGGVGQGFLQIIGNKNEALQAQHGQPIDIVSIADLSKGALHNDNGLDLAKIDASLEKDGTLHHYEDEPGLETGWDVHTTITKSNADVVVELTYTDVETGQPALDHCKAALSVGKHVVTTNKGPIVNAYKELQQLAANNGVSFLFEGTVMSGTPALRMPAQTLMGNDIRHIRGILNGTTNSMLTEMASGMSYEDALVSAQAKGYAEADPTNDVEGYDVQGKVVILANVLLEANLTRNDVPCQGISHLTTTDIADADAEGKVWKLLGVIEKDGQQTRGYVRPEKLDKTDTLAQISGPTNAVAYECDLSGEITLTGAGAGITETGYAVLIDILTLGRD